MALVGDEDELGSPPIEIERMIDDYTNINPLIVHIEYEVMAFLHEQRPPAQGKYHNHFFFI